MFKSYLVSVIPFSCLVRTFPFILPRQFAVTPPNLWYLENGLIRVMQLYLRPPKQCGFKSHQVPAFSGVGIRKYNFFRPNIDHMRFCYGLIRVMWLNLRPSKQCGFKSHQVPNFSGVGIRKYTFFPAKYRPYAFLLWADTRNVVAPSPAITVWVQIPPCAKFFMRRYKKILFFRPNIDHMRFCYARIRVMWLHLRPPEQCGFKSHQVPTYSGVGIRKYTFFRPIIDHMPFCYFIDIINFHTVIGMKPSTAE